MENNRIGAGPGENPYARHVSPAKGKKAETVENAQALMKKATEERYESLLRLVRELVEKQGGLALGKLQVHEDVRMELEKDLAEGGYWSAEKTAERILDFARSLAGDDKGKIGLLRDAVQKGFDEAERILGSLPDISRRTYDLVMQGFEDWEKNER